MTLARMDIPNIVVVKREKAPSKSMRPNEEKIKATMNFIPEAMHDATSNSRSGHEERTVNLTVTKRGRWISLSPQDETTNQGTICIHNSDLPVDLTKNVENAQATPRLE
jgi:hypothetical protein